MEPNVEGLVLHFPQGRTAVDELIAFEPADESVGIFGTYIEVTDMDGQHWVLNDNGQNWIHPFKFTVAVDPANPANEVHIDEDVDWNTISGTFTGHLWPEPEHPIVTLRKVFQGLGHPLPEDHEELDNMLAFLDYTFGIGIDTELTVD